MPLDNVTIFVLARESTSHYGFGYLTEVSPFIHPLAA
jgi:hypothetical protein